jgi:hypothetical protein
MSKNPAQDHLRILLDGEEHGYQPLQYYKPGQTIKGIASYTPPTEVKVHTMTILFKATLYNEVKESGQANYGSIRTGHQSLFRYEKTILQGPHKVSPKPHDWAFEFEVPEKIKVPFVADLQPVPPSWNVVSMAKVTYSLKLCVNPHRNTNFMQIERDVNVWPFEHTELPLPTLETQLLVDPTAEVVQRTNFATQRRRSSTLSLTQQLSRRRSSTVAVPTTPISPVSSTPNPLSALNLAICMPSSLGAWQRFDISLICHNTNIDASSSPSTYTLQSCELSLKAQVSFTTSRPIPTNSSEPKPPAIGIARFKLLGRGLAIPCTATPVVVKRDMMLVDMTRGDASMLVPDFCIGAFKLEYLMDVTVQLLDTTTGATVEKRAEMGLRVLPGGLVEDRGHEDEDAPPGFHEVMQPPDYEDEHAEIWAEMHRSPAYTVTA